MSDDRKLKSELWKQMTASPLVMVGLQDGGLSAPLTVQLDKDQVDTLLFFVRNDNRLVKSGPAMAHFAAKGHDFFASISGQVSVLNDPALIDKLWTNAAAAWFEGGKSDPSLTLVKFAVEAAELWGADVSLSGKLKMVFGGSIQPSEAGSHAQVENLRAP